MTTRRIALLLLSLTVVTSLGGCLVPARGMPDVDVIGYDGKSAVPPDCEALTRRSLLLDAGLPRPSMQWGCATYTNLAAQVANPRDFVAPPKLAAADAAVAASAVHRYETGRVIPLDAQSSRDAK